MVLSQAANAALQRWEVISPRILVATSRGPVVNTVVIPAYAPHSGLGHLETQQFRDQLHAAISDVAPRRCWEISMRGLAPRAAAAQQTAMAVLSGGMVLASVTLRGGSCWTSALRPSSLSRTPSSSTARPTSSASAAPATRNTSSTLSWCGGSSSTACAMSVCCEAPTAVASTPRAIITWYVPPSACG